MLDSNRVLWNLCHSFSRKRPNLILPFSPFQDDHLFTLEKLIKMKVVQRELCMATLMGEKPTEPVHVNVANVVHSDDEDSTSKTKAFAAGIRHKKLRCLKV